MDSNSIVAHMIHQSVFYSPVKFNTSDTRAIMNVQSLRLQMSIQHCIAISESILKLHNY